MIRIMETLLLKWSLPELFGFTSNTIFCMHFFLWFSSTLFSQTLENNSVKLRIAQERKNALAVHFFPRFYHDAEKRHFVWIIFFTLWRRFIWIYLFPYRLVTHFRWSNVENTLSHIKHLLNNLNASWRRFTTHDF